MLLNLSNGVDASRRTEAMQALANAQRGTSQEEQDRPRPIEPRWWYPPQWTEGMATMPLDTQQQHAQQVHATIVPFAPMDQRSGTLRTSAPEQAQIPELATVVAYDGWTGTQTIYLRPKKKKRKPHSKKKEDTDESSDHRFLTSYHNVRSHLAQPASLKKIYSVALYTSRIPAIGTKPESYQLLCLSTHLVRVGDPTDWADRGGGASPSCRPQPLCGYLKP
jgi:hypothetical protein